MHVDLLAILHSMLVVVYLVVDEHGHGNVVAVLVELKLTIAIVLNLPCLHLPLPFAPIGSRLEQSRADEASCLLSRSTFGRFEA